MEIKLNAQTQIIGAQTSSERCAAADLLRDMSAIFTPTEQKGADILLEKAGGAPEGYTLIVRQNTLVISAADDLGLVYGMYAISRELLGFGDFWFWNDQQPPKRDAVILPEDFYRESKPAAVRYRGWFVNDEVLLHKWSLDCEKNRPWEMVMETLLRCGGNMIIPGTDQNAVRYRGMAAKRGLYITHHHAEPLGAEMFARAYPKLEASYDKYPQKYENLWREAIREQNGQRVIWNLGFRGQGDCPFWINDPRYDTDESRGRLMSELIQKQYNLVREQDPQAVCCTNLYGETMELYQKGCLHLPDDIIRIWADNGYGKMVSRRQGNYNPRIPALPPVGDSGKNGIYYHVSFYDLQAANHMTMLPNSPEFVRQELTQALAQGARDYWIVNCSNVKPHTYLLDWVAALWRGETKSVGHHRTEYCTAYYGREDEQTVSKMLTQWPEFAVSYGPHEDDRAGEQFFNHCPRMLACQYMRGRLPAAHQGSAEYEFCAPAGDMQWAAPLGTLADQVQWMRETSCRAACGYAEYLKSCQRTALELTPQGAELFEDTLLLQVQLMALCSRGAELACQSLLLAMKRDYLHAFYLAGKARECYVSANQAMRSREHGKWQNFYENECLTDIKQTAWVLESYMGYLRCLGDGPHYYQWQRDFIYPERDRRILLVLNMDNHLTDSELFTRMKEKWE